METTFIILDNMRRLLLDQIRDISIEQLNHVPNGFNNNIIWNFGHVLVTQELLCYKLSGAEVTMPKELIEKYNRGTRPSGFIGEEEYQLLHEYAASINGKLRTDYHAGKLAGYKPYTTSLGVPLDTLEAAIMFLPVHEGMHLGYIMALKRAVNSKS